MKKRDIKPILFLIFIAAMVLITVISVPLFMSFKDPEYLKEYVDRFGILSVVIILLLQIFQIVVALIPGEVVEFAAGTLYGWPLGLLICISGVFIGQFIVFKAVRVWGKEFVQKVAGSEKLKKYKFLQNERKLKTMTFILYFIPGTPKDVLTYVMPLTKIEFKDFMTISILARLVSVISSVYAGESFADRNYLKLGIIYLVIALVSLVGVFIHRKWEEKNAGKHKNNSQQ